MSAAEITALCTGIVSIIAATAAAIMSIRNGWRMATYVKGSIADSQDKDEKLHHITLLVNSRMAEVMGDLKGVVSELKVAREEVAYLKQHLAAVTGQPSGPSSSKS